MDTSFLNFLDKPTSSFWRERQILAEIGIDTALVSTRCPPKVIASHSWAEEAQLSTAYLVPLTFQDVAAKFIRPLAKVAAGVL